MILNLQKSYLLKQLEKYLYNGEMDEHSDEQLIWSLYMYNDQSGREDLTTEKIKIAYID